MARTLAADEEVGACGLIANVSGCTSMDEIEGLNDTDRERAYEFARIALNMLTAGAVANCPITVRPCRAGAMGPYSWSWTGLTYIPPEHVVGPASWLPVCGCTMACQCAPRAALDLNRHVAEIVEVKVDGVALEETDYRLAESRWLYRVDGVWPPVQDMDLPPDSVGTFTVMLRPGYALGLAGEVAYGRLATEFAKSLCGDTKGCALPTNVKMIVRRGVTMELGEGLFPNGKTGLRDVDLFVQSINPKGLTHMTTVLTPEIRRRQMRGV
jgi:hypothetical protein